MLGHYILVAFRNFRRAPVATGINVLALALGLTCFVVAYAVVGYWGHAERGFAKADRTYVIDVHIHSRDGNRNTGWMPATNDLYAKYLKLDFPEFETVARAIPTYTIPVRVGDRTIGLGSVYVDPSFLDIFNLPFIEGDPKTALEDPNGVVITDVAARQLFGTTKAIGRRVRFGGRDVTIAGVIGPIPQPSHLGRTAPATLKFDVLANWTVYEEGMASIGLSTGANVPPEKQDWLNGYAVTTYVTLPKGSAETPHSLTKRLQDFVKRRVPPSELAKADLDVRLIPVRDLMKAKLNAMLFSGTNVGLSVTTLLMLFGGLVLLVACVNYANLATAQALLRTKEVGLRKVIGANRFQIVTQYFFEAGILTITALVIALGAAELLRPIVKNVREIDLALGLFSGAGFWVFVIGAIVGVTLLAGAYPALYLSRVRPIFALRQSGGRSGPRIVPTVLVGCQFAAASFLLIAVIVMQQQSSDLRRTGLGAEADPLLVLANNFDFTHVDDKTLATELRRIPQVKSVAGVGQVPWETNAGAMTFAVQPGQGQTEYTALGEGIGYDYFSTLEMRVLAGRSFDRSRGDDKPSTGNNFSAANPAASVVIDRVFARHLGFSDPQTAIGRVIYYRRVQSAGVPGLPVRIIGVVESRPLHFTGDGVTGSAYFLSEQNRQMIIRLSRDDVSGGLKAIKALWARLVPGIPFKYDFMDTLFDQGYAVFGNVFQAFTGLALFAFLISAIGLFGMGSHVASRRRREIGVRKTLGASTRQIAVMLLTDFSKPVIVANLIAWPVAYLAANAYLNVFIHRIALSPAPFALSLAVTVLIAWAAVGTQAFRAARVKPSIVLRYE